MRKFKSAPAAGTAAAADSTARHSHPEQASSVRIAASTAAGVTVGSIVGHAIGNALSSVFGLAPVKSNEVPTQEETHEECTFEFQEFYNCALRNEKLDNCKAFHDMWMKCQSRNAEEDS